ncbi:MAG: helix-hairpin-helix domain-containing protein [Acidobacteria bacterium]|nr:helix-hairpin-helix domain-containing protein [Acidobacteriota bacterium]
MREKARGEISGFSLWIKIARRSAFHFGLLIFAFCLLLSPTWAQERINLNTAPVEELMRLPYVGQTVARRILEHRQKHGPFKRPQDIIIIKGLSTKRYREIAHLIRI